MYINENWSTSNSKDGVFYAVTIRNNGKLQTRHYYTVNDLQTAVQQFKYENRDIVRARRFCKGTFEDFTPETRVEQSQRENENHCECIALEMEAYAAGEISRCPECGEALSIIDAGDKYKCPHCGAVADTDDFESLSLFDYFGGDIFDVEYRIGSEKEYRSVRLMVACGGPNIYIDTASQQVELYWWTDRATYPIHRDVCDEIDSMWAEWFHCL